MVDAEDRKEAVTNARVAAKAPLFADLAGGDYETIHVYRLEPEEEGHVGKIDVAANEEALRAKFGGGKFRLQLKDSRGSIKSTKTLVVGGEPVFQSLGAKARYHRTLGLPEDPAIVVAPVAAAAGGAGMGELLTLFTTFQQMQASADSKRAEMQARMDADRRRDDEARDERRRKEEEESRRRDREHQTQILQLITQVMAPSRAAAAEPQANLLEAFTSGMKTALSLQPPAPAAAAAGDEDDDENRGRSRSDDPIAAMVRGMVAGIADKVTGGGVPAQAALPPVPEDPNEVKVRGTLGAQMQQFVEVAKKHGKDPTVLISRAMATLQHNIVTGAAAAAPPAGPAAQQAGAPADPTPAAPPMVGADTIAAAAARLQREHRNGVTSPAA